MPVTAAVIVQDLEKRGIFRTLGSVHHELKSQPDTYVQIFSKGFMLRSEWESLPERYFRTSEEVLELIQVAMNRAGEPMRPIELIAFFAQQGLRIYGNGLTYLCTLLSRHRETFQAYGRNRARWSLKQDDAQDNQAA